VVGATAAAAGGRVGSVFLAVAFLSDALQLQPEEQRFPMSAARKGIRG